ncbi:MAG: acetamidase/formamidase family protein [Clostridiaceae bacterium]|nr:acetamidase/formamidase family protein [Clostridiaceae bacterium]
MCCITVEKGQFHLFFDKDIKPSAFASSGDKATFLCRDCYDGELKRDNMDFCDMDMSRNNPASGPLYIREAEPGDVLKMEILSITPDVKGCMCARPQKGIYQIDEASCRVFEINDGKVDFDGLCLPLKPMIGVIGTAPSGDPVSTQTPGEHGGNLDIKDLGEGCTIYLPVNVPGALLSMGDLHGIQGDGETVICALEMQGSVTVKTTVLKKRDDIPMPFIITPTHYLTTAANPSLDVCSIAAARKMHEFLTSHSSLGSAKAGMLLSLKGNLRISQVVNPAKGCIMDFPKDLILLDFKE